MLLDDWRAAAAETREAQQRLKDKAKEVAPGGLGVVLAIVRNIARLHGGVAEARSGGAGKGAEFTLRLPSRKAVPQGM